MRADAVLPASTPNASEMLLRAAYASAEAGPGCTRWCADVVGEDPDAVGGSLDAKRGTRDATRWSPSQHARVAVVEKDRCIVTVECRSDRSCLTTMRTVMKARLAKLVEAGKLSFFFLFFFFGKFLPAKKLSDVTPSKISS